MKNKHTKKKSLMFNCHHDSLICSNFIIHFGPYTHWEVLTHLHTLVVVCFITFFPFPDLK